MSTAAPAAPIARRPVPSPGLLLVLLAAGWLVCFALIPLHVDHTFGLPAHPLFVHIPVVLDPVLALVTLALVARPAWRERYGLAWGLFAVVALAGTVLTIGAGEALLEDRGGRAMGTIADHKQAAETLRLLMFGLVAVILALLAVDHLGRRGRTIRAAALVLSIAAAVLALAAGFFTVRTGHLGAKATWAMEGSGPPSGGGFPGQGGGTGGTGQSGQNGASSTSGLFGG